MGLTELRFDLTSWKYCTSKLTIGSHNYVTKCHSLLNIKPNDF